jgi:hypothetical protein
MGLGEGSMINLDFERFLIAFFGERVGGSQAEHLGDLCSPPER